MKLLKIDWIDCSSLHGWRDMKSDRHGVIKCRSVGYEIKGEKGATHLAQSISDNGDMSEIISIPNSCITRRRVLRHK